MATIQAILWCKLVQILKMLLLKYVLDGNLSYIRGVFYLYYFKSLKVEECIKTPLYIREVLFDL